MQYQTQSVHLICFFVLPCLMQDFFHVHEFISSCPEYGFKDVSTSLFALMFLTRIFILE
jgi:hypothetical protein